MDEAGRQAAALQQRRRLLTFAMLFMGVLLWANTMQAAEESAAGDNSNSDAGSDNPIVVRTRCKVPVPHALYNCLLHK